MILLLFLPMSLNVRRDCASLAFLFFAIVASDTVGTPIYQNAQSLQHAHEASPECQRPPSPMPVEQDDGGWTSGVFGDPHLATFDGLRFDCQASGEFTMVKSLDPSGLIIQERFTKIAGSSVCDQASVSTGIAIAENQFPAVQISIPTTGAVDFLSGCPVNLFVDGIQRPVPTISSSVFTPVGDLEIILESQDTVVVHFPRTRLRVTVTVRNASSSFGCFLLAQVFIPYSYTDPGQEIFGLLGKPNNDAADDWVDPAGNSLPGPANEEESVFGAAYDYCVSNWCIRDETESIFTYTENESFASISECDAAYASQSVEQLVLQADTELVAICEGSLFCLVDGVCGTMNDAILALQDDAEIATAQQGDGIQPQDGYLFPFGTEVGDKLNVVPGSTYTENESFASISECDAAYASQSVEQLVLQADTELVAICEGSLFCLVDGVCGTMNDAILALQDDAEIATAQQGDGIQPQDGYLFPFGTEVGDKLNVVPGSIDVDNRMSVFGRPISKATIFLDGYLTFQSEPADTSAAPLVAAFWSEHTSLEQLLVLDEARRSSDIGYIRFTVESQVLGMGETIVRQAEASSSPNFTATSALVATWGQFHYSFVEDDFQLNAFQLILMYDDARNIAWAIFSYSFLQFFGIEAVVGWNDGSGNARERLFDIQLDADLNQLVTGTNCGRPGVYAFELPN